ncbi:hypothetical protein H5410_012809 [Solanum commersonii]|uniref:Uncharacterized protein n=1 Tax=Solanum commersonii TaxID=4109 RepID=A0A9J6ATW6_SOLCO|nr:hypothetical protein H5410_012809 [Solanum commersonii]
MDAGIAIAAIIFGCTVFSFSSYLVRNWNLRRKKDQPRSITRYGNMVVLAGAGAVAAVAVAANSNSIDDDNDRTKRADEVSIDLGASAEATVNAAQSCCCGGGGCGGGDGADIKKKKRAVYMLKEDEKCSTDIDEKLGTKELKNEIKGLKKTDFESSKRKFEEQSAEQKETKRRLVMLE